MLITARPQCNVAGVAHSVVQNALSGRKVCRSRSLVSERSTSLMFSTVTVEPVASPAVAWQGILAPGVCTVQHRQRDRNGSQGAVEYALLLCVVQQCVMVLTRSPRLQ